MKTARFVKPLLLGLPLALALAACGSETTEATGGATSGEPIAKIAAPAGTAWSDMAKITPEGGYLMGNPDAPIKLIEFGALSCGHCADFAAQSFGELKADYVDTGRVSYELRLFMLNALDVPAALLATCGAPEAVIPLSEQFWKWQPTMFTNLQTAGEAKLQAASALPPEQRFAAIANLTGMDEFFASRGIAKDQGATCLADSAKATALAKQTEEASEKYNVNSTPTLFVNGRNTEVATWAELEPILQQAGAR